MKCLGRLINTYYLFQNIQTVHKAIKKHYIRNEFTSIPNTRPNLRFVSICGVLIWNSASILSSTTFYFVPY